MNDGQELARALRAAYWEMHRRTNAVLSKHGVTADQFVLLSRLADDDAITQQELARRASSDANTIRSMLVLLQEHGLVARKVNARDGRAHCVVLTTAGRRRFGAMMKDTECCRRQMVLAVRHGSAKGLWKNLNQIAEALGTADPAGRIRGGSSANRNPRREGDRLLTKQIRR